MAGGEPQEPDLDLLAEYGYAYFQLLRQLHLELQPRSYIEIGVRNGLSLQLVRPDTLAIGVDPTIEITVPLPPLVKLFEEPSDVFFDREVADVLDGAPLDLSFIDGMHHFEFALRDFVNLEKWSHPDSIILIHDCLPIDAETAARECTTVMWSGDVWKLIVCLKRYRPDLEITTIDVSPTGLGIVRGLDPTSRVLADNLEDLYAEFVPMEYDEVLGTDKCRELNCVEHDWRNVLAACGRASA